MCVCVLEKQEWEQIVMTFKLSCKIVDIFGMNTKKNNGLCILTFNKGNLALYVYYMIYGILELSESNFFLHFIKFMILSIRLG